MEPGPHGSGDRTRADSMARVHPLPSLAIVTQSPVMLRLLERVRTIAASNGAVLLVGETGVGKELFADAIHRMSPRHAGPLVKISLSAMPHELLESELFGHVKGAFTNALADKKGLFELAHGGSLLLDDVDDVPAGIQTKLLRVLESHEVQRVGGSTPTPVDVRVIASSKVDLKEMVERGRFRADLFYRIHVLPVQIPPLRERPGDVPLLVEHFLRRFAPGREVRLTQGALETLDRHHWPGNVRELRNVIQRVALFAREDVRRQDLPAEFHKDAVDSLVEACTRCFDEQDMTLNEVLHCLEQNLLTRMLKECKGNRSEAARRLGLSVSTLRDHLKKHGLDAAGA